MLSSTHSIDLVTRTRPPEPSRCACKLTHYLTTLQPMHWRRVPSHECERPSHERERFSGDPVPCPSLPLLIIPCSHPFTTQARAPEPRRVNTATQHPRLPHTTHLPHERSPTITPAHKVSMKTHLIVPGHRDTRAAHAVPFSARVLMRPHASSHVLSSLGSCIHYPCPVYRRLPAAILPPSLLNSISLL